MATARDVMQIGIQVVNGRKNGKRYVHIGQHNFDTEPRNSAGKRIGMCSKFVRQCYEEAQGLAEGGLKSHNGGPFACCAHATEINLRGQGAATSTPEQGDIVCFNNPPAGGRCGVCGRQVGHIAIYIGDGMVAENTSSWSRGNPRDAGTKLSKLSSIGEHRISGFYRLLPGEHELKVVLLPGLNVINCNPAIEDGTMRVDVRAVAESLGYEVIWHPEQQKAYLRKAGGENDEA